ncbi:E3 binding domain-containing protein [Flavobacteriaceae bacterium]|nr:E3 binding domain-containing protein [Flavobacteriaceae bacterium]
MGQYHLKLPKMGESVAEATVTKWLMEVGDTIQLDDPIVEIATDKVDTDVTSEVEGILIEKCFAENEVVKVGETLVIIEVKGEVATPTKEILEVKEVEPQIEEDIPTPQESVAELEQQIAQVEETIKIKVADGKRFYSPLVRNIAKEEGIPIEELDQILGTGKDQRLTKKDLLSYLERRTSTPIQTPQKGFTPPPVSTINSSAVSGSGSDQFREMTRMENLIANHMMSSLKTSAHVQSFIEVDVTHLWDWREGVKDAFQKRENDTTEIYGNKLILFVHHKVSRMRVCLNFI